MVYMCKIRLEFLQHCLRHGNDNSCNVHISDLLFKERNPTSVMCVERRSNTAIRSQNTVELTLVRSHMSVKHARNASLQIFT